ncbi:hypothetical protein OPT61_g7917 [Boeremia exigua]|uniref:Uncharacterized protein n=1 Tax=Boeremia exigua TaxID=749465 RepID=A0ACC2I0E1_9PLEO|nr:hypothetical protein OPT61_g7917 [Boeremia exigua]
MSFLKDYSFSPYSTPPQNYVGSTFFLTYIVVALYLTTVLTYSLYKQYTSVIYAHPSSPPSKFRQNGDGKVETRNARVRHIKIYTVLALISFTSISWHMLGFLITSFLDWNGSSTRNILAALSSDVLDKLKRWMMETTLFNDFAIQLVADGESAVWTQLSILATWGWNLWLGQKGRQYGLSSKTMILFIILGQTLPISFTVTLFIIQLHLLAPDMVGIGKEKQSGTQLKQQPIASSLLPTIVLNAILLALPSLRGHPGFSYLVLAERALLFLPHMGLLRLSDADLTKSASIAGGFIVANWAMLRKSINIRDVATALMWKGQAVKTMGWDALLSLVVYGVLSWGGGV